MKSIQALNWRYATKKFDTQKKISLEQEQTLIESLRLTPTSFGLQPFKLLNVKNPKKRKELLPATFQQQQVIDASHLFVLCKIKNIDEEFIDHYIQNISKTRNIEIEDLHLTAYKKSMRSVLDWSKEQQDNWMKNQVYIALGNLLTICAFEKIDACPMEGFNPNEVDQLLQLEKLGLESVLLCPVGYRHKDDLYAEKRKVRKNNKDFLIEI